MKNLFIVFCLMFAVNAYAQIQSVTLQASGLTCSMCSRAIYKSLQKVPSVGKIQEDIEHSSYHIRFSDPAKISLENLKKAVLDAGFSVAWMEVKVLVKNEEIASDSSLKFNGLVFQFVDIPKQMLNGEHSLLILDKDFILEKDRKKYPGSFEANKAEGIFHVTLLKS